MPGVISPVHRVALDGLGAAGKYQAPATGLYRGLEQVGGGEDVVRQQLVEAGAGMGNAGQVHDDVDPREQAADGLRVVEVQAHEAVWRGDFEVRLHPVGEGEAVALLGA